MKGHRANRNGTAAELVIYATGAGTISPAPARYSRAPARYHRRQHSIAAIGPVLALGVKQERALAVCRDGSAQGPDGEHGRTVNKRPTRDLQVEPFSIRTAVE